MRKKTSKLETNPYIPSKIELKWQDIWEQQKIYSPNLDTAKKPFYNLMMFPYPSAEGMHVGNMYAFTGADVYGRFVRMKGYDVFEPIGLDGFGIHSENYAIKVGRHPKEQATISEANFYRQLHATGNGFDWSRTLKTYDPKYYKWTQWLFIQLFKAGLAYRKKAPVNFCPSCKTVLADEQIVDGKCERCSSIVKKRELEQWFFRITKYADRLLTNIAKLDWSEKVKIAQRQWIGKSEGALVRFVILSVSEGSLVNASPASAGDSSSVSRRTQNDNTIIEVFTTRPDTLFGATFLVLSPEHPLVNRVINKEIASSQAKPDPRNDNLGEIIKYLQQAKKKTEQERIAEGKNKAGVFIGLYAINPVNNKQIPIWVADYVLMGYGTGAIMGVPAHDERDFEFAKKYGLPIKEVIIPTKKSSKKEDYLVNLKADLLDGWPDTLKGNISEQNKDVNSQFKKGMDSPGVEPGRFGVSSQPSKPAEPTPESAYLDFGILVNSGKYTGLSSKDAREEIINDFESRGIVTREVSYHLRDWLISRQRYWGPPIPMIYCKKCGWQPVPEKDLPVLLPDVKDWKPTGSGKSPLASIESFVNTNCPNCKGPAKRETDVSDTFLDSSWYFLRYTSTDIESRAFDIKRIKKWLPVKMYIGGAEHSVLHLLYSRFITMSLHDLGLISFDEPFSRFYAHGLLIREGAKMSKSKGNVVVPDQYIKKYGADTLRCYLMFLGPFDQGGDFYDTGIEGMYRFLKRAWTLVSKALSINKDETKKLDQFMHKTINRVTQDMEGLRYNTAIAHIMEYYNGLHSYYAQYKILNIKYCKTLVLLLAPFAPHMAEELYHNVILTLSAAEGEGSLANASPASAGDSSSRLVGTQNDIKNISIHKQPWPKYDPKFLEEQEITIVVQVDGKVRETIKSQISNLKSQISIENKARESERIKKHLQGKSVKKIVYVEGKIINFVTE